MGNYYTVHVATPWGKVCQEWTVREGSLSYRWAVFFYIISISQNTVVLICCHFLVRLFLELFTFLKNTHYYHAHLPAPFYPSVLPCQISSTLLFSSLSFPHLLCITLPQFVSHFTSLDIFPHPSSVPSSL